MRTRWFGALAAAGGIAIVSAALPVTPFSSGIAGAQLPGAWRALTLPGVKPAELSLVDDAGTTVLRVRSVAAAGSASHPIEAEHATGTVLSWRWKVDRVIDKADLQAKSGDDFAARVYVFFDVPSEDLPLGARVKYLVARLLYGEALPTTAICYVWDNRHPVGTSAANPYTERVRTVVLESGSKLAGSWKAEARDVASDFRAAFAFPPERPVPRVSGIAAGNDTDQTGESATAWFGDFRLEPRR